MKVYGGVSRPDCGVPFREERRAGGNPPVRLYDTSGPDVSTVAGLPKTRQPWLSGRTGTQFSLARAGVVTPEMEYVAIREDVPVSVVVEELAAGRAVLPVNVNHPESEPMILGQRFLAKVRANIGTSAVTSTVDEQVAELRR